MALGPAEKAAQCDFVRLDRARPGPRQIATVSGIEVPIFALDLPAGLRGQAREQVARRQLSDRLGLSAERVEMRPFAPGGKPDSWTRVLVADRALLANWRGQQCRAVLPDYLMLPCAEGLWTVAAEATPDDQAAVMVRLGPEDGFTAAPSLVTPMLTRALDEVGAPRAILLTGALLPDLAEWAAARDIPLVENAKGVTALGVPAPVVLGHGELSCDLRRDPQAARSRLARKVLPWRWPALAGTLAVGLWVAADLVALDRIESETAAISAATRAAVAEAFVTSGPILDIRVQVSRALAELRERSLAGDGGGTDPVDLGWQAAEVLGAAGARTEGLDWTTGKGLTLVVRVADFAAADRIAAALAEAGLATELVDSRAGSDTGGVRAEYLVRGDAQERK